MPTFQAAASSGIQTLTGDTGGAISPSAGNITLNANTNSGQSVLFSGSGSTISLNVTDSTLFNTFIGLNAGKSGVSGSRNVGLGYQALTAITTGQDNVAIGYHAMASLTTGSASGANVGIGTNASYLLINPFLCGIGNSSSRSTKV